MLRALMLGQVMVIDEFERSLHPLVGQYLIEMFLNPQLNKQGAQLILASHDTFLLNIPAPHKDQIWFVEKDRYGRSSLYARSDIQGIRAGIPIEKWYLSGRLGAVPGLEPLNFELNFHL
ncbi:MAG: hypothetical protein OHK0039_39440 [Bacteroidia bacterium]